MVLFKRRRLPQGHYFTSLPGGICQDAISKDGFWHWSTILPRLKRSLSAAIRLLLGSFFIYCHRGAISRDGSNERTWTDELFRLKAGGYVVRFMCTLEAVWLKLWKNKLCLKSLLKHTNFTFKVFLCSFMVPRTMVLGQ